MTAYNPAATPGYGDRATWPAGTVDPADDDEPEYIPCGHCGGRGCYKCKWTGEELRWTK